MKLSRTAAYATHALASFAAAKPDEVVTGHRLAKALKIPPGYTLRILVMLSRAQLLWAIKGPNGGYRLARPAKEITLLDVIEAVDGTVRSDVAITPEQPPGLGHALQAILEAATQIERKQLRNLTIAGLSKR